MLDWDSPRYLEAHFAIPMSGAILQMVNPRLPVDHIRAVLRDTGARVLLCHRDFAPLVAAAFGDVDPFAARLTLADDPAVDEYEALLAKHRGNFAFETFDENSVATLFHTSGTTGTPKAVSYTHRKLVL